MTFNIPKEKGITTFDENDEKMVIQEGLETPLPPFLHVKYKLHI